MTANGCGEIVTSPNPIIVCAENIVISYLLRSIPLPPSRNHAEFLSGLKRRSPLPFDTDRKLVGTLAFIAYMKDDVEHIPAICLEDDPASGCLKVIFAVNKVSYNDGQDAICHIQQGLEHIFALLATVSGNQIITAVVSMCSSRILSRLRLAVSARNKTKRPFKDTLREARLAVKIVGKDIKTGRSRDVEKLLDSWFQYQVDTRLVGAQIMGLADLICIIPNKDMSPSLRQSLLNIINKVARYWEVARFLYRTAKKFPLARAMRTAPIAGAAPRGSQQKLLREICAILKINQQELINKYTSQVMRTLTTAKIHAEIQIIAHCELQNPRILPRVICSSKDACFLCNLCLRLYQKIYTPKWHGRLYPGWRLPFLPQLAGLEQGFCKALEKHYTETCGTLLSTRRGTIYPDPNESTLTTARASVVSRPPGRVAELPGSSHSEPRTEKTDTLTNDPTPSHHYAKSMETELDCCTLMQSSRTYRFLTPGESSEVYKVSFSRSLQIQIKHATCNDEAAEVREKTTALQVINTEYLESIVILHKQNTLYLIKRNTVLKISWSSKTNIHPQEAPESY
ncbi:nucleic acid/nucleotide deaminase domain-containing protein [Aspergillus vadensis CBS 113365]|uniref:Uncharacterized protein n=1 Tax=Aspergillus vadensis (strain CBS 113365 / IMI 142717 / IBT 24658) TaxID=1448311 RepID=A0A319B5F7_ASPVC|nr:hypothetical protein BO88DRAFT_427242 [Aspergillus vadensis CBS 113365]PYH67034.1 hypothetical protein BO88DRAFT_427242 [Aspergillus vadensis CBS 113365]